MQADASVEQEKVTAIGADAGAAGVKAAPWEARQARWAQAFSSIVAVLMRDPAYRNARLADLEHLVIPAVVSGQWRLGYAPQAAGQPGEAAPARHRPMAPVAAVLWASVSDEIDKLLAGEGSQTGALTPDMWASGDNAWVIVAAGDKRSVARLVDQLLETDFAGKQVKVRARGPDDKILIQTFGRRAA